jgi:hypothetical protein
MSRFTMFLDIVARRSHNLAPATWTEDPMRLPLLILSALIYLQPSFVVAAPLTIDIEQVFLQDDDHSLRRIGDLEFISGLSLTSDNKHFGGLSDLSVSQAGELIAITDKGYRLKARLLHDGKGNLVGLTQGDIQKLQTTKGRPLKGKKKSDAEGLARTTGGWFVSFEHKQRIWFYQSDDPASEAATKVKTPKGLGAMPANGGLESLVELTDGRLLTFSEDMETADGFSQGWLRTGKKWQSVYLQRTESFAPTGMTRLASGDVLVLERSYSPFKGPAARIRLLDQKNIKPGARLRGREIGRLQGSQNVDNMEGISAVMTPGGERIYLMSDDNFNPLQRTLFFMLRFADQ